MSWTRGHSRAGRSGALTNATMLARNGYDTSTYMKTRRDFSGARFDGDFRGIESWTERCRFFLEKCVYMEFGP